jgi:hypothetical protein
MAKMRNSVRYLLVILSGFLFGILVFLPINEFTSYYEYNLNTGYSAKEFVLNQFFDAITLRTPVKLIFYLIFGGLMGALVSFVWFRLNQREKLIIQLKDELEKDLSALIRRGEDDGLEFKSSYRYDYRQEKVNKALESVIIKTIAGFANAQGGSLLIGVADDGTILGLQNDYNTLNRKDQDGFTQLLMTSIADKLGTPTCRLVRVLFHQQENKEVCRVIILPSPIPIYAKEENQSHFYIRTASGTREMDLQEAITFIKAKWG